LNEKSPHVWAFLLRIQCAFFVMTLLRKVSVTADNCASHRARRRKIISSLDAKADNPGQ